MENTVELQETREDLLTKSLAVENEVSKKKRKHRKRKAKSSESEVNTSPVKNADQNSILSSETDTNNAKRIRGVSDDITICRGAVDSPVIHENEQKCDNLVEPCAEYQSSEASKKKKKKNRRKKRKTRVSSEQGVIQERDSSSVDCEIDERNGRVEIGIPIQLDYSAGKLVQANKDPVICEANKVCEENESMPITRADQVSDHSISETEQENFELVMNNDAEQLQREERTEASSLTTDNSKSQESEEDNSDPVTSESIDLNSNDGSSIQNDDPVFSDDGKDNENSKKIVDNSPTHENGDKKDNNCDCNSSHLVLDDERTNNDSVSCDIEVYVNRDQIVHDSPTHENRYQNDNENLASHLVLDNGGTNNTIVTILEHDVGINEKEQEDSLEYEIEDSELGDRCYVAEPAESCSQNSDSTTIPEDNDHSSFNPEYSDDESCGASVTFENDFPQNLEGNNQNRVSLIESRDDDNRGISPVLRENVEQIILVSETPESSDHCFTCNSSPLIDDNKQKPETSNIYDKSVATIKLDKQSGLDSTPLEREEEKEEKNVFTIQDQKKNDDSTDQEPSTFPSTFASNVDNQSPSSQVAVVDNIARSPRKSLKRPPSRGQMIPLKKRKNKIIVKTGFMENFAATLVFCFLLVCHAFCALLSVFKRKAEKVFSQ